MSRTIYTTKALPDETTKLLQDTAQGKVLFTKYDEVKCALFIKENRILAAEFYNDTPSLVEGVYVAKVKDAVKNMNSYFVDIQKGLTCFLPGKEVKKPILLNRDYDGRLLQGDEILVEVIKDAQKTKAPMVSARLSERKDYDFLQSQGIHRTCYSCVAEPGKQWKRILKNLVACHEYREIITDDSMLYEELLQEMQNEEEKKQIRLYEDSSFTLSKLYSLKSKLEMALERRIWLKSGAYLYIEPTEAMTVIDVNSGKYEGKKDKEEYFFRINKEAAKEIAVQLRLRNLSGIIMVDFINMKSKEQKEELLTLMKKEVEQDMITTVVVDITPLGLMEITRQKINKPLHEQWKENRKKN